MERFIELAKIGVLESNYENGNCQIQRIDDPESMVDFLGFLPPLLDSDDEAEIAFNNWDYRRFQN